MARGPSAIRRAQGVLAGVGADWGLQEQVDELAKDLEMVRRLEEARLQGAADKDGHFDYEASAAAIAEAFAWYGLAVETLDAQEAGAHIRSRSIRMQMAAALDEWAYVRRALKLQGWVQLLAVARVADPDPWRDRLRDALAGKGPKALEELATTAVGDELPPATAVLLSKLSRGTTAAKRVLIVLRQVQQRHPADFWVNQELGECCLMDWQPPHLEETIRYWTAAVALRPQSPAMHLNFGIALYRKGLPDEAIVEFQEALRLKKDFVNAHNNLGIALDDKGLPEAAIGCFRKAIELNPEFPKAHRNLGRALTRQGNLDEAVACCRKAIELDANYNSAYTGLGIALQNLGKIDDAIAAYQKVLDLNRDDPAAHTNLGGALSQKGKLEDAIACHQKALELDPNFAAAHNNLGHILWQRRKLDDAIACYRKAIELDPNYAQAYANLGGALADQRKLDDAIACCRKAIDLDPKLVLGHFNLGNALKDQGKLGAAVAAYQKALDLNPRYPEAYINQGNALVGQAKLDDAIGCFRAAIKLDPRSAFAHNNLGVAHIKKGELDAAVDAFRDAFRLNPDRAMARPNLGFALNDLAWRLATHQDLKQRDPPKAIKLAKEAVDVLPKQGGLWNTLGVAQYRSGEWRAAVEALNKAVQLRGENGTDSFFIAMAYWQQGDKQEARKWNNQAVAWMEKHQPQNKELRRIRAEAAALLGIVEQPQPKKE